MVQHESRGEGYLGPYPIRGAKSYGNVSVRGSFTGRRITDDLVPVFAAENDSHLTGPDIVSLKGRLALHTTAARTKLG
jgi:hypothetical protein